MRNQRGVTLIELLIAITVFLLVLAGAMSALSAQGKGFNKGAEEMGLLQNLRYGVDQLDTELRTAGANTPARQPVVVYAGPATVSFNADYVSNLPGDISAVYVDPSAPAGQVSALTAANAIAIPGSTPAFVYPSTDYPTSPAETITFWFTPDAETARTDDYRILRQVNNQPAEPLVRGVLAPTGGGAFFRYWYLNTTVQPNRLDSVPTAWVPLAHTAPQHGQLPDTGTVARIDNLRMVEMRYRVTNGLLGAKEQIRSITAFVPLVNAGVKKLESCGDSPLFGQVVLANPLNLGGVPSVTVTWNASPDEAGGERDVIRYVIWRRTGLGAPWGDPYASIPSGAPPYSFTDADVVVGGTYQYAVAAQDCTPNLSALSLSLLVVVP
jgi:prepilin-type N-terminal cleavage/methylation domain-containing protein